MHRLFKIDDLLYILFSMMSSHELAIMARVHSTWRPTATSLLRSMANSNQAMEILFGHVNHVSCRCTLCAYYDDTNSSATSETWKRFQLYAPFIKEFHDGTLCVSHFQLKKAVGVARVEGSKYFFPNLRYLKWEVEMSGRGGADELQILSRLIGPSLTQFYLGSQSIWYWPHPMFLNHICRLLQRRVPALDTFELIFPGDPNSETMQFIKPVENLLTFFATTLRSVRLPGCFDTGPIIQCLSKIENICSLKMDGCETPSRFYDPSPNIKCIRDCHRSRQFPSLCSFAFTDSSAQDLHQKFLNLFDFSFLTYFKWFIRSRPQIDDIINLIRLIPLTFPRLRTFYMETGLRTIEDSTPWASLQPLLRCKDLIDLRLPGIRLSMDWDELIDLLSNRTSWTILEIFTDVACQFHLQDLYVFAKYCPNLIHLGVNIAVFDSSWPDDPELLQFWFPVLQSINLDYCNEPEDIETWDAFILGELLYYICEKAVRVYTSSPEFHEIAEMTIAAHCISGQIDRGSPWSEDVTAYVNHVVKRFYHLKYYDPIMKELLTKYLGILDEEETRYKNSSSDGPSAYEGGNTESDQKSKGQVFLDWITPSIVSRNIFV